MRIGSAVGRRTTFGASTQTISPDVRASAARMAAEMRSRSWAEMLHHQLPDAPPPPDEPPPPEKPPPPIRRRRKTSRRRSRRSAAGIHQHAASRNQRKPGETMQQRDDGDQAGDEQPVPESAACSAVEPQRGPLLPFGGVGRQHGDDVVDAARDAAAEIAGLEARRDGVGDDDLGQRVGQRAFQPVADLDAHPPLVRRDQQQHAVVLGLLAELPGAEQLVGVGLDLLALERA